MKSKLKSERVVKQSKTNRSSKQKLSKNAEKSAKKTKISIKVDNVVDEIKKKERKEKALEDKKLKLQKKRHEMYKDSADPTRFYVTNGGLLQELTVWKENHDPWLNSDPGYQIEFENWKDELTKTNPRWNVLLDEIPQNTPDKVKKQIKWIRQEPSPSERLGNMFMQIAYKLTNHSYFRNYTKEIKEDCISYAMEKCVTGIKNYNFKFKNPFAYFTQSCFNSFKTVLSKHYKQINIRRSIMKKIITDIESDMPNSGMKKCLDNRFANDDYYDCEG